MTLDFRFSEEQEAFVELLQRFTERELIPRYIERSASTDFPFDTLRRLGELGVLGIGLPERYGGIGVDDPVLLGLATETLAAGDVNLASAPIQIGLVAAQLLHGTEEVQERYLPGLIAGEHNLAIALTEPGSGSDAAALRTTATKVPGGWRLNGEKTAISWAMSATAAVVYARTPGTSRSQGISCFVVPLDLDAVTRRHMLGMGCLPLGWGLALLGAPGAAFKGVHPAPPMRMFAIPGLGRLVLSLPTSLPAYEKNAEGMLGPHAMDAHPAALSEVGWLASRRPGFAPGLASCFRGLLSTKGVRPGVAITLARLATIGVPTLMAWGDQDVFLRPDVGRASIDAVPGSTLLVIADAGHAPWLDEPHAVGKAVSEFLDAA
ncbi:acyl-CoA dehydrogenase family protein [Microbacterium aurum]